MSWKVEDVDRVVILILDGVQDKRILHELRKPEWGLTLSKARKLLAAAHEAISEQDKRPPAWHRARFDRLFSESMENANYRVALDSARERVRLDGVHNVLDEHGVDFDESPESARSALVAVTKGVLDKKISANTSQALLPNLKALMAKEDEADAIEDLSRREISADTLRESQERIIKRLRS